MQTYFTLSLCIQVSDAQLPLDVIYPIPYLMKGSTLMGADLAVPLKLIELRKSPSIIFGSQDVYVIANQTVFAYVR